MQVKVYWTKFTLGAWTMYGAATEEGLCYIGTPDAPFAELESWVRKRIKNAKIEENETIFQPYINELEKYFLGESDTFTGKLDLYGTTFQKTVWNELQNIAHGETLSYSDIAERLQNPRAVRAVGSAIGANPILIIVPCHRVITKDGKLGGFRAGLPMKEDLLKLEKVKY